ncbi:AraC family transcriptional regulator [Brucella tritici]|nr:AraC family transcriptional regulator [Brucella tritici]
MSDNIELWHDRHVLGGMDILQARCRTYRYDAHSHDFFVVAAFSAGAQKHRIARTHGIAVPGTVMIIPPGEMHTGESAKRHVGWDYSAFYPSVSSLDQLTDSLFGHSRGSLDFGTTFLIEDVELSAKLLAAAEVAHASCDALKRQEVVLDAFEMLIRRYGRRSSRSLIKPYATAPIQKALDYIMANLTRRLSIKEIAVQAGLSEFHFMRLFKLHTNMTVHQYVTHQRLEAAKPLLAQGASSASVAASVGFYDQSHFTSHFRRTFGLTPRRYATACR